MDKITWKYGTCLVICVPAGYDTDECSSCKNDHYDALRVCHVEKRTKILLFDDSDADYSDDVAEIEFLKDFKSEGCENPLEIKNFQLARENDNYVLTATQLTPLAK